jgi:DNA-binding response OmpR family regulator
MAALRILVAEDDIATRELLAHHARREAFEVLEANDGPGALRVARDGVDVVLLDVGLPGIDGFDVVRTLRREGRGVPIVLLTARTDEVDRIVGFELGADDYVGKPFSARELFARVRAIARRSGTPHDPRPILLRFGRLEVDEAAREARVDGRNVGLKPREFALLLTLARSPGVAFSRSALLERVWGYDFDGDERTVDVHVRRLRLKIEEQAQMPAQLRTVHGYGYKFVPQP